MAINDRAVIEELRGNAGSSVVHRLLNNGFNLNALRTNAILRKDEWKEIDERVTLVAQERLVIVDDLISAGLVLRLGGIGTTISSWSLQSDMTEATLSMEPDSEDNRDLIDFREAMVPIPIIHKDFRIGLRQLEASRRMGSNIDTLNADAAARKVAIAMEELVFNGYANTFSSLPIYGVTTHPDRITGTAPGPWTDIDNIYATLLAMLTAADAAHRYGPFNVYVSAGLGMSLLQFYPDGSGQTVQERLNLLTPINNIRVSDVLPPNRVVMVQMTSDNIDIAVAQDLTTIEWDSLGGMVTNYKVMSAMAPRIKADIDGNSGIVDYTIPA